MADPTKLQATLNALSDEYAAKLPERLGHIEKAWEQLPKGRWDEEGFQVLHRMVHSLAGSGGTFGFSLVSDVARSLEKQLDRIAEAKAAPGEEQSRSIMVLLSELRQVAMREELPELPEWGEIVQPQTAGRRRILVVGEAPQAAEELKVQLGYFGYEVSAFSSLADFRIAVKADPEAVVLMDITLPEFCRQGIEVMNGIQQGRKSPMPVIFLAERDEFATRLEAARAGGIAYLDKPANIGTLVDKLDALASPLASMPYRILIVDDSEALTAYYAAVLEAAGMRRGRSTIRWT